MSIPPNTGPPATDDYDTADEQSQRLNNTPPDPIVMSDQGKSVDDPAVSSIPDATVRDQTEAMINDEIPDAVSEVSNSIHGPSISKRAGGHMASITRYTNQVSQLLLDESQALHRCTLVTIQDNYNELIRKHVVELESLVVEAKKHGERRTLTQLFEKLKESRANIIRLGEHFHKIRVDKGLQLIDESASQVDPKDDEDEIEQATLNFIDKLTQYLLEQGVILPGLPLPTTASVNVIPQRIGPRDISLLGYDVEQAHSKVGGVYSNVSITESQRIAARNLVEQQRQLREEQKRIAADEVLRSQTAAAEAELRMLNLEIAKLDREKVAYKATADAVAEAERINQERLERDRALKLQRIYLNAERLKRAGIEAEKQANLEARRNEIEAEQRQRVEALEAQRKQDLLEKEQHRIQAEQENLEAIARTRRANSLLDRIDRVASSVRKHNAAQDPDDPVSRLHLLSAFNARFPGDEWSTPNPETQAAVNEEGLEQNDVIPVPVRAEPVISVTPYLVKDRTLNPRELELSSSHQPRISLIPNRGEKATRRESKYHNEIKLTAGRVRQHPTDCDYHSQHAGQLSNRGRINLPVICDQSIENFRDQDRYQNGWGYTNRNSQYRPNIDTPVVETKVTMEQLKETLREFTEPVLQRVQEVSDKVARSENRNAKFNRFQYNTDSMDGEAYTQQTWPGRPHPFQHYNNDSDQGNEKEIRTGKYSKPRKDKTLLRMSTQKPETLETIPVAADMVTEISRWAARQGLPPQKPPRFSGDPKHWRTFKEYIESQIIAKDFTATEKFHYLLQLLDKEPRGLAYSFTGNPRAFVHSWERLSDIYGNKTKMAMSIVEELGNGGPITTPYELLKLADSIQNAIHILPTVGCEGYGDRPDVLKDIIRRLDLRHRQKWRKLESKIEDRGQTLRLSHLYELIAREALAELRSNYSEEYLQVEKRPVGKPKTTFTPERSKFTFNSVADAISSKPDKKVPAPIGITLERQELASDFRGCQYCFQKGKSYQDHKLQHCTSFTRLNIDQRRLAIRSLDACWKCLEKGHKRRDCPNTLNKGCNNCGRLHHQLLHTKQHTPTKQFRADHPTLVLKNTNTMRRNVTFTGIGTDTISEQSGSSDGETRTDTVISETASGPNPSITLLTQTQSAGFSVVPVRIRGELGTKCIYAILDPASTNSYIDKQVASVVTDVQQGKCMEYHISSIHGRQAVPVTKIKITLDSLLPRHLHTQAERDMLPLENLTFHAMEHFINLLGPVPAPFPEEREYFCSLGIPECKVNYRNIAMLIGLDQFNIHQIWETRPAIPTPGKPYASRSVIGWYTRAPIHDPGEDDGTTDETYISKARDYFSILPSNQELSFTTLQCDNDSRCDNESHCDNDTRCDNDSHCDNDTRCDNDSRCDNDTLYDNHSQSDSGSQSDKDSQSDSDSKFDKDSNSDNDSQCDNDSQYDRELQYSAAENDSILDEIFSASDDTVSDGDHDHDGMTLESSLQQLNEPYIAEILPISTNLLIQTRVTSIETIKNPASCITELEQAYEFLDIDNEMNRRVMKWLEQDTVEPDSYDVAMSENERRSIEIMEKTIRQLPNGHYEVGMLWRDDVPKLINNRPLALRRLQSIRERLLRNQVVHDQYRAQIDNYIEKGYAVKMEHPDVISDQTYYLPHHYVTHPNKPGRVRVVCDCQVKYRGMSLNSQLMDGPNLNNYLIGVLMRFRQRSIAFTCDIEAMFHQVYALKRDTDSLRFLWYQNKDLSGEPSTYQMLVRTFGVRDSPNGALFALKQTAIRQADSFDKEIVDTVKKDFYTDDGLKSCDTECRAIEVAHGLQNCLANGGFHLTKFISNSTALIASFPEKDRGSGAIELEFEPIPVSKVLGLSWDPNNDSLKIRVRIEPNDATLTKRICLSKMSRLFDPLCFVSPIILQARIELRKIWQAGLEWDEPIHTEHADQWNKWEHQLPALETLELPRVYFPKQIAFPTLLQLHCFCDASCNGLGVVAYFRRETHPGHFETSFVTSKAKTMPNKFMTIPRAELQAATIAIGVAKLIKREIESDITVTYWTDATLVLTYINHDDIQFKTFVANRRAQILEYSIKEDWRHCPGTVNPADIASRGMMPQDFCKPEVQKFWLRGPEFLSKSIELWPPLFDCKLGILPAEAEVKVEKIRKSSPEIQVSSVQSLGVDMERIGDDKLDFNDQPTTLVTTRSMTKAKLGPVIPNSVYQQKPNEEELTRKMDHIEPKQVDPTNTNIIKEVNIRNNVPVFKSTSHETSSKLETRKPSSEHRNSCEVNKFPDRFKPPERSQSIAKSPDDSARFVYDRIINMTSSFIDICRKVAWIRQCIANLRGRGGLSRHLSIGETDRAEFDIIQHYQLRHFLREYQLITEKKAVTSSSLVKWSPTIYNGLICHKSRLQAADISYNFLYPIIIPPHFELQRALILDAHIKLKHAGRAHCLSFLRNRFVLIKPSKALTSVMSNCITCKTLHTRLEKQEMSNLPLARVQAHQPPFTNTGVDCFGPFQAKLGRVMIKRWGAIFTCTASRAIHIERVSDMTTNAFILALRRFIARRGLVRAFYSDRGSNFVGADNELKRALNSIDYDQVITELSPKHIEWNFNVTDSPWRGGIWERMIRSIKLAIHKTIPMNKTLNDDQLITLFAEIESVLNSRPIALAVDSDDNAITLTPNHLLMQSPAPLVPASIPADSDLYSTKSWKVTQLLASRFWEIWQKFYLPSISTRTRWYNSTRNLREGDFVLLAEKNLKRHYWLTGIITKVKPDTDGIVRTVTVKTIDRRVIDRPVQQLVLLEEFRDKTRDYKISTVSTLS